MPRKKSDEDPDQGRRRFLAGGVMAAAAVAAPPFAGFASTLRSQPKARAERAYQVRLEAARSLLGRNSPSFRWDDSDLYARFSKGLPHDERGEVEPRAYSALLGALRTGKAEDFESIPVGGSLKLVNPQASLAFALEGADSHAIALDAPPRFDSAGLAAEAVELYWQALTRDVPFTDHDDHALVRKAADELSRLSHFNAPKAAGRVTPGTLFRGPTAGDLIGPPISQFLWKEVPWGAVRLVQHVRTATPGLDYLRTWDDWLAAQNGAAAVPRHGSTFRYIRSSRDLASYTQLDFPCQAFEAACLILFGMQGTTDAQVPYRGAPYDRGNPYRGSRSQSGFVTFGAAQALDLVSRVVLPALRAGWYQKWLVHRFLRPEELGGRVEAHLSGRESYPVHDELIESEALALSRQVHGSYLLPQAFPEAAPLHPSYPSGHAAIAGACATVLKAFFDESFAIDDPVVASRDGLSLLPYGGKDLTVGGEIDKLAWNVASGRNAAGIHWRCDAEAGLRLGEAVAFTILRDMRECFNERFAGFSLTTFAGEKVVV